MYIPLLFNSGNNNLLIKLNYMPNKFLAKDQIYFNLSLYRDNTSNDICFVC